MQLRSNLAERAVVDTRSEPSVASPEAGVRRVLLERDGDEIARATSVVTYAPGSRFFAHTHERGEEFLVLEGTFRDEHGVYPAGTYVRNPWGSRHAPSSPEGCVLFVKLRHMRAHDRERVVLPGAVQRCVLLAGERHRRVPLYRSASEEVWLERCAPSWRGEPHTHEQLEEFFVLEGAVDDELGHYPSGTWCRQPPGSSHGLVTEGGCLLFVKRGPTFEG